MLFEGENITWTKAVPTEVKTSDQEVNEKYWEGEVRIVTKLAQHLLYIITAMVVSKKTILMPAFQDRHKWNTTKKFRLKVMDGLQRMTTILNIEFGQGVFA